MKKKYTRKMHIHRISLMMKRKEPCKGCPASRGFKGLDYNFDMWKGRGGIIKGWQWCKICWDFIGMSSDKAMCPCTYLGKEEALKRTLIALEKEWCLK